MTGKAAKKITTVSSALLFLMSAVCGVLIGAELKLGELTPLFTGAKTQRTYLAGSKITPTKALETASYLGEVAAVSSQWHFPEARDYFKKLAEEKGAELAYAVLLEAELPPNLDMHLLGHVVGDVLYKQKGVEGMQICTSDFRNACSHAIVVGMFDEFGETALPKITEACRTAPGGKGAYTMCFHGLGHGIFAATAYDIKKAVSVCSKTGNNPGPDSPEAVECMGGMIMELMGGGDHDKELWTKKRLEYVSSKTPLRPCSDQIIPESAKYICYIYLTPHLFQSAGASLGHPTPADFAQAFTFCDKLPRADKRLRDACFGGFGKEFTVLARDRDIRRQATETTTDGQLQNIHDWCLLAKDKEGVAACIVHSVNSLYWGGENSYKTPLRFCTLVADSYNQGSCFAALYNSARTFHRDAAYWEELCADSPETEQNECRNYQPVTAI